MANSEQFLTSPVPLSLSASANSFVSNWADKRSSGAFGISVIFYSADGYVPDGYCWLEVSNAPMQSGTSYGQPNNGGDDAMEYTGSQQNIELNTITGLYSAQWQVEGCGAHFVRVRYVQSGTQYAGLSVNVYFNGVFFSN